MMWYDDMVQEALHHGAWRAQASASGGDDIDNDIDDDISIIQCWRSVDMRIVNPLMKSFWKDGIKPFVFLYSADTHLS